MQLLSKKGNNYMRGDDEDFEEYESSSGRQNNASKRVAKKTKVQVLQDVQVAMTAMNKPGASVNTAEEKEEQVRTLKEVLEEREEQMKDIEQL